MLHEIYYFIWFHKLFPNFLWKLKENYDLARRMSSYAATAILELLNLCSHWEANICTFLMIGLVIIILNYKLTK